MRSTSRLFCSAATSMTLSLSSVAANAQTGRISGTVVDITNRQPIENVQVIITGTAFGAITKANGTYVILSVPPGTYVVEARRLGYGPVQMTSVNVGVDITRTLNFALSVTGTYSAAQVIPAPAVPVVEQGVVGALSAAYAEQMGMLQNTRLFPLQHLSNEDAASLVAPFAEATGGRVFDAGNSVRGITVRGTQSTLASIDSLLKETDRPTATLLFRFDVIAALDSNVRDPQIPADVATALRESFSFAGYRLLSQSTITITHGGFSSVMYGASDLFHLDGTVQGVRLPVSGSNQQASRETQSVSLNVRLSGPVGAANPSVTTIGPLINTALRAPIGQVVILGSASPYAKRRALILVLRPTVVEDRRE